MNLYNLFKFYGSMFLCIMIAAAFFGILGAIHRVVFR